MDAAAALRSVRTSFPDLGERRLRRLGAGWANECWLGVGTGLVFRFPRTGAARAALAREAALMPVLAPTLPLAAPAFPHVAADGTVAAYPLVPGTPLTAVTGAQVPALARLLTALHAFPRARAVALGLPGGSPAAWRAELARLRTAALRDLASRWPAAEVRRAAAHMAGFAEDAAHFAFTPVLIHGDLVPEHLLADPATGRLTGVIDFEDARIGDPAMDFAGLGAQAGALLAAYGGPADPGLRARAAFYRSLVPVHEALYGVSSGHAIRVRAGLAAWRRQWAHGVGSG